MPKEYIDREYYCNYICRCPGTECDKSKCPIWTAPAADVAPVVHGEWIRITGMAPPEYHGKHKCSVCGGMALCMMMREVLSDYCPYCGAKMDRVEHGN